MDLKYKWFFVLGIVLAIAFLILSIFYKSKTFKKESVKLANTDLLLENKYYKAQLTKYYILRVMLILAVACMIILTAILLARPYYIKKIKEQKYNRDIILCMDISSSVDELNLKLVRDLQDTVRSLAGERIGIVIFNTTPVVLSPLTDDYEYIIEQLENVYSALKSQQKSSLSFTSTVNWLYQYTYLYGGTLVGNEMRGSSLIGDGLLGGLFAFPEDNSERTKIIIFSTDNDPNGEGFVNLQEAADYCTRNDVTVYGIGTKHMYTEDRLEMEAAVKSTGGKFFLEENSADFHQIVEEIEDRSAYLTEGETLIKPIESPEKYFAALVLAFLVFVIVSILLRRANVWWSIGAVSMAALLILTYLFAVIPAKQFSKGPDVEIKRSSNMNVVFVVDDTISMLANDTGSGDFYEHTRLGKAKDDMCAIVDELEGARFSIITFNNDATLLAPFSKDSDHVKNAIRSITPLESYYARGSSLNVPKELMNGLLSEIKADSKQKTAVFFVSDGEITSGESLLSYSELAQYVDAGAVLGYGTSEGGTMTLENKYTKEREEVMDYDSWPVEAALSRIDESNLEGIAKDLSVEYINMTDVKWVADSVGAVQSDSADGKNFPGLTSPTNDDKTKILVVDMLTDPANAGKLALALSDAKSGVKIEEEVIRHESGEEYITPPKYYGFYALLPFALLLISNAVYVVREKRL